jgi:hypothetical protein
MKWGCSALGGILVVLLVFFKISVQTAWHTFMALAEHMKCASLFIVVAVVCAALLFFDRRKK